MGDPRNRRLEQLSAEMNRLYDSFGLGRDWLGPRPGRPARPEEDVWFPEVEVLRRKNQLLIRADLPGLTKDDVQVHVSEDTLTIQGERKWEQEEAEEGIFRSERRYGSFYRTLPLPAGAAGDQAKASFKNGVLEIMVPLPAEASKWGRRLDILE